MAKEIIKEILLKFKGDSKPLEREMKNVEKMAQSLTKAVSGGGGQSGPSQLSKTLDTYIKQSNKFGISINKDMTKFQKTIQEVAVKDLKVLQRNTDDLFRKSEDRLKKLRQVEQNIQAMEQRGANARQMQKQNRKRLGAQEAYRRSVGEFEGGAEDFNRAAANMPKTAGNPLVEFFGPVALARMAQNAVQNVANLPSNYDQMMRERLSNQSYIAQQPLQQRMAAYQGDLSMALLAKKGVLAEASSDRERARTAGSWKTGGNLLGGAALAAGGVAALIGSGILEVGSLGAATPLALGGAMAGGSMITGGLGMMGYGAKRAITDQTSKEAAEAYNQSVQNRSDMLIDPKLYQAFREETPRRNAFNQIMGYTSGNTRAMIIKGMNEGMLDADETMGYAQQFRGVAGADRAGELAVGVGRANLRFGMEKGSAATALANLTKFGQGGGKEAEKNLEDVMRRGMAGGLKDYGMREEFAKAVTTAVSQYSGQIDADHLAASVASLLQGGKGGIRDIEAAVGAKAFEEDMFAGKGSPLEDAIVTAGAVKQLKGMGAPVTATTMDLMKSLTIEDIKGKSKKYEDVVGTDFMNDPAKQDQMVKYVRERERSVTAPYGDTGKILSELDKRSKSGIPLTAEETERYSQALGASQVSGHLGAEGLRQATPESLRAKGLSLIKSQYDNLVPTTAGEGSKAAVKQATDPILQSEEERKKNDAYFQQQKYNFTGKAQEETDKARFTPKNVAELAEAQKKANAEVKGAGETVNPTEAAANASDAMVRFSTALDTLTRKINGANSQSFGTPRK